MLDREGKCLDTLSCDIPGNAGGIVARGGRLAILDMERNTFEIYTIGSSGDLNHVSFWTLLGRYTTEVNNVQGVAMDNEGNIYVTDPEKHSIDKYCRNRELLGRIQTGQVNPGPLAWHPRLGLLTVDMVNKGVFLLIPPGKQ